MNRRDHVGNPFLAPLRGGALAGVPVPTTLFVLAVSLALASLLAFAPRAIAHDGDVSGRPAEPEARQARYTEAFAAGQEALLRDDYRAAADAFRQAYECGPDSALTGDALYWQSFALYRNGGTADLSAAAAYLERLQADYRMAGSLRDAIELTTRIHGELARRGDAASAALIAARAMELRQLAEETAASRRDQERGMGEQAVLREIQERERLERVRAAAATAAEREYAAALAAGAARSSFEEPLAPDLPAEAVDPLRIMALARTHRTSADEEDDVRMAALTALASMDQERTIPIIESVLARRDEDSARLREQALMILSMNESVTAEELLLQTAKEDPDPAVRGRALVYLGTTSNPEVLGLLESILLQPGPLRLQEDALSALQFDSRPQANEILHKVAECPSAPLPIRARALLTLGERKAKTDLVFFQRLYAQLEDPALKEAIVMAAGFQESDAAREWLLGLVGDPQTPPSVLQRAIFRIGEDRHVATRTLIDLYARLEDRALRRQTILVIGQRGDAESLEFVIRIAREEQDPELRRAAIFFLGESRDPRALDVLQELIAR